MQSQTSLNLERALTILRRRWWAILLCFVLTAAAAYGISRTQPKRYTATASLLFTNTSVAEQASGVQAVSQGDPLGQRNTNLTLVQLGSAVPRNAAAQLNAGLTPTQVKGAVSATQQGQSNVVSVSATWTSPDLAARIANAYTNAFILQQRINDQATVQSAINLVQGQYTGLSREERLTPQGQSLLDHLESLKILKSMQNNTQLVQLASVPSAPSSPKVLRNTLLGAFLGLLLGVGLAFLLDRLDRRLREPSDVEESFRLPMLGLIPHTATGDDGLELEPYRMLRAHLRYFNVDRDLRILLVTSAKPAEGKTTVARNLAATAANMGTKSLLIEADLRKPVLAQKLGLEPSIGLAGALVSMGSLPDAIQHVDVENQTNGNAVGRLLDVLQAGGAPPNPNELLESQAMEHLLTWAREHYELVVIDTAPLSVVADTIPLTKRVDGVIVVSRLGLSTRDTAENLRERLETLGAPVLGIVVNDVKSHADKYYGYGYVGEGKRKMLTSRSKAAPDVAASDVAASAPREPQVPAQPVGDAADDR